jgi:uncharacterized protein YodC (DUF2158 family)
MIIGTDVRLKSGSALMTVSGVRRDGHIYCMWFDPRGKVSQKAFPKETLVVVLPPTPQEIEAQRRREKREEAARKRRVKAMVDEMMGPEEDDVGER